MRVVVDTNVLVSALMSPHGPPAAVLQTVISGAVIPLFDDRILAEYRAVLARPKLRISPREAEFVVGFIETAGILVTPRPITAELPDLGDLPFIEVAVSASADALVTGNARHVTGTPVLGGIPILSPAEFMALWRSSQG